MPSFNAINLEPEEDIDEEIDNTREIAIEEALKRFQTALKLHAQGPQHYTEAAEAYNLLFNSEIFTYPEASTEFERAERQTDPNQLPLDISYAQSLEATQADIDGTGSSLPQALYLAYKNHSQFRLDEIKHDIAVATSGSDDVFVREETVKRARNALHDFCAALDQDPSDAELWRRAARVAAFLKSTRTSRYCLEAAIELDDDPAVEEVEPPSLAEGFAGEQLKEQLKVLSDDIALGHPIMTPYIKRSIPTALKKYIDPSPFLPDFTKSLAATQPGSSSQTAQNRTILKVPTPSWADLGMSLVHSVGAIGASASAISIELPEVSDTPSSPQHSLVERPKPQESAPMDASKEDGAFAKTGEDASKETREDSPHETKAETAPSVENLKTERSGSVLSRKRSQSTAGLPDGENDEILEKRSKRIRRRETINDESVETQTPYAAQLEPYQAADKNLFETIRNMAENLSVTDRDMLDRLAEMIELSAVETRTAKATHLPMIDVRDSLLNFDEETAKVILSKKEASSVGFSSFLEHSKPGPQLKTETPAFDETKSLNDFAKSVNDGWMGIPDIAFEWVKAIASTYLKSKWSDAMKTAVVQVISHLDGEMYERMQYDLSLCMSTQKRDLAALDILDHMVQMLFELHLDVYERITNPNSAVDYAIRAETKERLRRWFSFASQMSRERSSDLDQTLSVRFLWAAVFSVTLTDGVAREHVLECWRDLRDTLASRFEGIRLRLPNNAIMPEISILAADREISKLTTMDFFLGLFQDDLSNPASVIDSLEPVLNPSSVKVGSRTSTSPSPHPDLESSSTIEDGTPISETASQGLRDLWKFLATASTDLRLFLWTRLGDAYHRIGYKTKQFSCHLKSIEMVIADLERDPYIGMAPEDRHAHFVKLLKSLDELLVHSLSLALNEKDAFEIIDDDHLRSSIASLVKLSCILHTSSMFEDEVRVGMVSAPTNNSSFTSFLNKYREMQTRNWSLLYTLLKFGVLANKTMFTTPETDLADYLAAVHQVIGLRKFCKVSNKIFLKMMRVEFLKQDLVPNWEEYLGQVLYDLYGLKGIGSWEVQDHGCPSEKLERKNTINLVEKITVLAKRMPMKDLLKSELKTTIDHMQQAVGQTKANQQTIHNLRNFTEYLKRPIHPLRLYQAFSGDVTMDAVAVNNLDSMLANHGWFFLLGMLSFSKFKGVDLNRRQTPGATDDLRIGATFLRQQLQFTPDQWEAWFRLAECFDYELDEAVLWTADKMNKERAELVKYQRNAIHCYTLALSHSWDAANDDEASEAIHGLYYKFGMRMYASSREPFAMEPFKHEDHERFFIQNVGSGTYKKIVHEQMEDYKVWKYAAKLFEKAMAVKPKEWKNAYMLAKCIWKMYQKPIDSLDHRERENHPDAHAVVKALEKSVEVVAALPKRRSGQDPILEPHYKIVSVIHKLVMRNELKPQEAADILQRQPLAIEGGEHVEINDPADWETYMIQTLTHLGEKDKSNWQHRIIMRHARILFDDQSEEADPLQAMAAFTVLQKSMFTKTMVMNVWKCDAERPGRHHVYTEQYVRFMVKLLVVLKDRTNFEALLRRLRKRGMDYYHFNDLWQTSCQAYLRLIRQHYQVLPVIEDVFKNVSLEEFEIITERVTTWASDLHNEEAKEPQAFSAMKEAVELKKLNAGLMKAGPIDDLIADCYSTIYIDVGLTLPGPSAASLIEERRQKDEESKHIDSAADTKHVNPFSSILNPASVENSGTEAAPTPTPQADGSTARHPRRAGVRRPDITRKAEQAVVRALEGPEKAKSTNGAKSLRGSVSSGRAATRNGSNTPVAGDGDLEMKDGGGNGSATSAPGSVHDSADDESELSDVPPEEMLDEEEAAELMFPNLKRRGTSGSESGSESESGEEHGDEEEAEIGDDEREEEDEEEEEEEGDEVHEEHDEQVEHDEDHEEGHEVHDDEEDHADADIDDHEVSHEEEHDSASAMEVDQDNEDDDNNTSFHTPHSHPEEEEEPGEDVIEARPAVLSSTEAPPSQ